ncbi:leucine-rich repeats and immunoglobulin-like domains protein 2 [Polypterus senegalus]|uniref:leucine-rich repeats and immunoglobulin-like domains protein 2 n=1 Tax=Polypterus senegalus TaxID=55291 RepID=UPI0019656C29|nr:leucine-rich repeats and immunoglobulin-like domains protein 2 [Polypterus senegalus]
MSNTLGTERGHIYLNIISTPNCDLVPGSPGYDTDGWTTVGIVIIVVVCCVVGTSLIWVVVIYHMRKRNEDYSIGNTDEINLPADIPSYLSSQGTLSEPRDGYNNSEAGSHQQLMPPSSNRHPHKAADGNCYLDSGCDTDADINSFLVPRISSLFTGRDGFPLRDQRDGIAHATTGSGTLVICSDCYDNANIYIRTRECYPYAYLTEEDLLDKSLSSNVLQLPKEPLGLPQRGSMLSDKLVAEKDMTVFLSRATKPEISSQTHSNETAPVHFWLS